MRRALRWLAVWLLWLPLAAGAEPVVLSAADLRPAQELDGEWTWSIDPFRTGKTGFHGGPVGKGQRRGDDTDVTQASAADPRALYEYDLDRAPSATLPGSWIAHQPTMRHYKGLVWYQRRFDAAPQAGQRQFLRFGAADYTAEVWLNGERIGAHEGGFTPFAIEVTGKLRAAGNRLVVGVDSERGASSIPPPVTDWEDYGGINQPVRLISVPDTFVDEAWIRLDGAGRLAFDVTLNGPARAGQRTELRLAGLGVVARGISDAQGHWRGTAAAPRGLRRWSPQDPRLYDVTVQAGADLWHDRIGFRTLAARGGRIVLNGKPVFLRGISIHGEELGSAPARRMSGAAARDLLTVIKRDLGGNYVRLAHYTHAETMLREADAQGLIVWSEIPVYWQIAFADPAALANARAMLRDSIRRDRNRAAVALWSVGNETPESPERNRFMQTLVRDVRALDPERLVTAALLTHREGKRIVIADPLARDLDVLAVNTYNGWYSDDRLADLPGLVWDVGIDKPLLISEFGADAKFGLHDTSTDPRKFSEEFQAEYYRQTLAMLDKIPAMAGLSPWILKDFRSPRRQRSGIQDGWNRKGLISETGQRKQAFDVLARYYAAKGTSE